MQKKSKTGTLYPGDSALDTARRLSLMALFSALVAVATLVFRIPIPITKGYFNLGDTVIFIAAALLGPVYGMVCGGVGSALADVIGGYAHFALPTLIIKGLEGLIAGWLIRFIRIDPKRAARAIPFFFCVFLVAGAWMVFGYYRVECFMYDYTAALAELPFNILQGGLSALVATVMCPFLIKGLEERLTFR
jgi:uncharacterized membrane protein